MVKTVQNVNQHKPNDFNIVIDALALLEYVLLIMDNLKTFPIYKKIKDETGQEILVQIPSNDWLINKARQQVYDIFTLVSTANEINLKRKPRPELKKKRLEKQEQAIELCNEHLVFIDICHKHFHLDLSRIKYWGELVIKLRNEVDAWNESDKDRYKNI